ncbi:hypothetical protein KKC13_04230 [bacterium]|nr:hypothetical protein [bacterium]MBU1958305.1 hypothetical protein [bacterium]
MNRAIILLSIVVLLMISGFMNYANYLQTEFTASLKCNTIEKSKSESYYDINLVGEKTLLLSELAEDEKKEIWNASSLKYEMIDFFPNFIKMSTFVNDRVIDNGLFKEKLLANIKNTEEQFIGGKITGQSAKETLSTF